MNKKIQNTIALTCAYMFFYANKTFAACTAAQKADGCVDIIKPTGTVTVATYIGNVTTWVLGLTGALAILFIIWGGAQYITSAGNKEGAEKAKSTLTYAVIGLIIVVLARIILSVVINTLSVIA